jgi:DNA-binding NarL/FixJ family response regulator
MRIVVVAGEPIVRAGIKGALESAPDLILVGECPDARSAFAAIDAEKPDLVVMDVTLRGMNGITATREVKRREPRTHVLLLSTYACERDAVEGFAAGADGFALKTEAIDTLLRGFRTVGLGGHYITPGLRGLRGGAGGGGAARAGDATAQRSDDVLQSLSPREREVLDLVLKGLRNREIAKELCVSMKTVDTHRTRINRKLGCAGSAALVRFAADNGLLHGVHPAYDVPGEPRTIVLLVDDDPGLRGEMVRLLAAQGCPPVRAASVTSALEELQHRDAASLFVFDGNSAVPTVRAAALLPHAIACEPFAAALARAAGVTAGAQAGTDGEIRGDVMAELR